MPCDRRQEAAISLLAAADSKDDAIIGTTAGKFGQRCRSELEYCKATKMMHKHEYDVFSAIAALINVDTQEIEGLGCPPLKMNFFARRRFEVSK